MTPASESAVAFTITMNFIAALLVRRRSPGLCCIAFCISSWICSGVMSRLWVAIDQR
jgi:hypothetical protein